MADSATERARAEGGKKVSMPSGAGREVMFPRPVIDAMAKHEPRQSARTVPSNK